ncbi:UDP-N-acetylenolpyruvoylglucosamine reductase [bacterium]|jgi:UDP-N-acetylmuramate dehydrogenase|nr:UDP-N-acetylenolpyruvoylglucosamine reductase [bacterium]MDP6659721.1 UDP-N-acetylmuramate dehydrogenase [Candidatus Paceibacterota bacterium]|tara:strand:- start:3845 stop:4840 length:996 start_codon:yes stop_codon:yes gene_type:complete
MKIDRNVELGPLTTFKIGGPASYFVSVNNIEELREAFSFAEENNLSTFILGGGSNILVADEGFNGLVIHPVFCGITFNGNEVSAGAGESWDKLVLESVERGYYTLSNLSNIPGSVGAAPVQNIGAYGVSIGDFIENVEVFCPKEKKIKRVSNKDCKFSYRDSIFKNSGNNLVITKVKINLKENKPNLLYKDITNYFKENKNPTPKELRDAVISIRCKKFPDIKETGTAGSFFKNPIIKERKYIELKEKFPDLPCYKTDGKLVKIPIAYIIERLGFKGKNDGAVGVYENHSLVLINNKNATFKDVNRLSKKIIQDVKEKTGIEIEKEVTFVN